MAKPVSPTEREQIIAAFETGKSCGQIAREFERSPDTISRIAKAEGHSFGLTNLANAHAARRAYGAEWRSKVRQEMAEKISGALQDYDSPALVYNFGGRDNTYNEHTIERPSFRDRRDIAATAATWWRIIREMDDRDVSDADGATVDQIIAAVRAQGLEYATQFEPEAGVEPGRE